MRALSLLTALWLAMMPAAAQTQTALPEQLKDVGIDQRLNERLPLETEFRDESGRTVRLGDYFGEKPVVLALVYYQCPMLCTMILNGMVRAMRPLTLNPGDDFEIVTISFDPAEGPALAMAKKREYIARYAREGAEEHWHFLTGSPEAIAAVTKAAGFRYSFDEKSGLWVHASAIIAATPDGRLARYLYGVEYMPRDLRFALVEASAGKIGSRVDQVLLYCFHYDPETGKYGLLIMNVIRVLGTATVATLAGFMFIMFRRDRRKGRKEHA